ncbi:hypothetical protein ACFQ1E_09880 [Sphingomonas canadensis]|uniref:Hemerythrin-like domain-containing protein n=1 Tax=Sphingomonas canadensis TaxID=1219257 RepID=A0ABW3H669_9SPHN|nr:hypothetical protein [Sphingomonas canadensis]MCW3836572.1 hypothetical protein [Sphingomonas canadensis]
MQSIECLRNGHRLIAGQAAYLAGLARAGFPDPASIVMLRWDLVNAVADHSLRVDRALCRTLTACSDLLAARAAWAHRQYHSTIQDGLMRFVSAWPVTRLATEWDRFGDAAETALAPLFEHLAWEERELFAHAERALSRRAA